MTSPAEEFAARGYLVAAVEHTYESVATTFPDGRTVTFEAGKAGQTPETGEKVARVRAADTEFVLDELDRNRRWNALIDEGRIAMVGHSNPRHEPSSGAPDGSWDTFWPHVTGDWKRWLTVTGAEHMCFIDSAVLQPQLGLPKAPIDGERAVAITRTYVTAFLDLHLKHKPAPTLV